ncbi:Fcf2 pre-rRNA processing-domain-containing protein [Globomyces pollinis-pini]|nr:Fcf2 pre-rRNA processing-domain-containing protein [Globomyces pollinis-pini]
MESTPLTEEIKRDLHIIKSRHVLDPKRHYKRDNTKGLPKFFQIGSIIGGPTDYYNRLTRKEQKQTLVQEIMQDSKTQGYIKRKMEEVVAKRSHVTRGGRKKKRK